MNKFKKILRITEHDDERVQALEYRSYAEAGFLIAVLSALDVIIRGLVLSHPLGEWGMSLFVLIIYIIYVGARQITMRITKDDLLEEDEKKKNRAEEVATLLGIVLFVIWRKVILKEGLIPSGLLNWIENIGVFIVIFIVTYGMTYLFRNKKQSEI
ncbi:DUF6773 family protein [Priestia aryabhattai]|uniref:DUF6773 family protein n=1 Tax=Priestia aryabhattai TaxID=412384 RepID=UPI00187483AE|nr:DUF6773 family protein [Priestia aryabhattai]MBE5103466.1 hypothetical protein [Priestia aryabhattai]